MKILAIIGGLAVLGLIFLSGYWFGLKASLPIYNTNEQTSAANGGSVDTGEGGESDATLVPEDSVTIDTSSLSDSQRQMLATMGVNSETITLTPAMVACAEAEVGVGRLEEIKDGATPSFSEGFKLFSCYTSN